MDRGICTRTEEYGSIFFSLHSLVKQAIELFIEDDDRPLLLKYVHKT